MLPTKYNCLSNKYTIEEVNKESINTNNNEEVIGAFSYRDQKVRVCNDLEESLKEITTAHEIIHSWLDTIGLHNIIGEKEQELLCDSLSHCLLDFLKEYTLND